MVSPGTPSGREWGGSWRGSVCSGSPQVMVPPGGSSEDWDWAGRSPGGRAQRTESTAPCCTWTQTWTNQRQCTVKTHNRPPQTLVCLYLHGWCARGLGVILRVDLWRGDFWVTGSLGVGGASVALRRGGGFVVKAEVVFLLVPANQRSHFRCFS